MPGPVPNRSEDLARDRSRKGGNQQAVKKGQARKPVVPHADKNWHPIAVRWFNGLKKSGQADFYEQSDWDFAYSLAEDLSMYKKPLISKDGEEYHKRSGQMLQTIYSAMERLLVTEADRRRARIELSDEEAEDEDFVNDAMDDYEAQLGVVTPIRR